MPTALSVIDPFSAVISGALVPLHAPVWTPWPLPLGWTFGGVAHTGPPGQPGGGCTVASWLGTDPFDEPAELLLVCAEAGADIGSRFAGLPTSYPGRDVGVGAPHAKFSVQGRPVPLWSVDAPDDRGVYAGEARGRWLWVIVHPAEASALVVQPMQLVDARHLGQELTMVPVGELSPRLMVE
ncbi:MAG: DUF6758 family protein [Nocardioidaceae bacterium]